MGMWFPEPLVVPHADDAKEMLIANRKEGEVEYKKAEANRDPVGTTVWGRVNEHVRKLALLYAISECHENPNIGKAAVEWASQLVMHQTRRMLHMAQQHVADTPFHADCLKVVRKLRTAPERTLPHSVLLKRMKLKSKDFSEVIETLEQQGDIKTITVPRSGWSQRSYQLTGANHG